MQFPERDIYPAEYAFSDRLETFLKSKKLTLIDLACGTVAIPRDMPRTSLPFHCFEDLLSEARLLSEDEIHFEGESYPFVALEDFQVTVEFVAEELRKEGELWD